MDFHQPVLKQEVLELFQVKKDSKYIDCTLGDGGHTLALLERGATVLGIDSSEFSLKRATERIEAAGFSSSFTGVLGNFRNLEKIAKEHGFAQVSGILYDLGFSSAQLDTDIGISFQQDAPLDMRLDKTLAVSAADLVNALSEKELARLIKAYSDEKYAKKFAKAITERRNLKKFQSTQELTNVIVAVAPPGYEHGRIHPATRVFQALRIAVNSEFENLSESLPQAARLLLPGGRMIVITFHSLEDKLVKEFGRGVRPSINLIAGPVFPTAQEINENVRARSSKLYCFEKTTE